MRLISTEIIGAEVRDLFLSTAYLLPEKVRSRLVSAMAEEVSPQGQAALSTILKNAEMATTAFTPLCQDTGLAQVVLELGQAVHLDGPPLGQAVDLGMRQAYETGYLRKSTCHPLTRQNLGSNSPVSLETIIVPGDQVSIRILAKGGGCDNKSVLLNLPPASSLDTVKKAAVSAALSAGPDSCPPYCLGMAIGGSFESAPRLARRALLDLWEDPPMTPEEEDLAGSILEEINASGLGPMGLGGRVTALGLRLKLYPCHIASLPIAVYLNCHSFRTAKLVL
ncbi:MAG: fumarate hydratase [Deltaproteobacteria bacterium]|jgi:fumarate hydratase subunit alpha|nr:fumarate hydratase [Deltaproteobacteria bacterium]